MVIDASVLTDMWIISRPRHSQAVQLARLIQSKDLKPMIPMHAVLELKCAIDSERCIPGKGELDPDIFSESAPLAITPVAIDGYFLREYHDLTVPFMKAGDLPYVLIAKRHNCALITEDIRQYKVAKRFGVNVYTISEYLNASMKKVKPVPGSKVAG